MKHGIVGGMVLSLLAWSGGLAFGEVTARWFDINPSRSNTDESDPNGASGGRVNHVGAASDFSRVYAATEWGGLYQSFDQGNSWSRVQSFSPSATWDVKVDPGNSQRVYVTSFFDGRVNPRSGISISADGGATWNAVDIPGTNPLNCAAARAVNEPSGWQIAINGRAVFAGTNCGLARSRDGGDNWDFVDPSPGNLAEQVFAVIAHGGEIVDVISDNGHFRSTNNGNNWTPTPAGPGPVAGNSGTGSTVAVSPAESYVLLAASMNDIFESQNGGTTWPTSLTLPLRNGQSNQQGRIPFVKTNQLSTSSQFDVWFGDVNLFKATAITPSTAAPGGAQRTPQNSWTNVQDQGHWDVGDVLFDPRFRSGACPSLFTNDGGVYRNTRRTNPDCQRPGWDQPAITPHATWLWGFDGTRLGPGLHALTYGLQDDGGFAATVVAEGHNPPAPNWNNYNCCDVFDNSSSGGLLRDMTGAFSSGRRFRWFSRNLDGSGESEIPTYPSVQAVNAFTHARQSVPTGGAGYVVNIQGPGGGTGDVYFTSNINSNPIAWTALNSPTAVTSGTGSLKVANLGGRPNVYYHTGNDSPESRGLIFRSTLVGANTAGGANWTALPLPAGIGSVTAWDVDPTNGNRAIISGITTGLNTFEIHFTQNFGANWDRLAALENIMLSPGGNPTFVARTTQGPTRFTGFGTYWQPSLFRFNPLDPSTVIAGAMDAGLFLSLDNGDTWEAISNPTAPTSDSPHIPRPLYAYFSPGRFSASTNSFDVWVGTRGAGVQKVVLETAP